MQGYYAILDVKGTSVDFAQQRARAERLLAGGPCCLQLRGKLIGPRELCQLGHTLRSLCTAAAVPLCINDRLDVALAVAADGVHLGQGDLPLAEAKRARAAAAGRLFIAVSTHDVAEAVAAQAGGADHVGFGPVFATRSKADAGAAAGLAQLRAISAAVHIPVVAIGGITLDNVGSVAAAGASAAAAIAAVDEAADPSAAGRALAAAFGAERARPSRQ